MAKRIKIKDDCYTILNFDQVDTHLKQLGALQRDRDGYEAAANVMIDQVKADLKARVKPIDERMQKHVRSLEAFCADHRGEFGKAQSCKLLFGVIGWRKSTSIATKKTTLEKIKDVFASAAKRYLHIKETPNKEALAKLTDEQLARVDARRVFKEEFYAEPDMTKADETGNGSS